MTKGHPVGEAKLPELAAACERESLRLFPANMRDGHSYHSTAFLLDKVAAALRTPTASIDDEAARCEACETPTVCTEQGCTALEWRAKLDWTPTGGLKLPRWQVELRAAAACLETTDKALTPEYRRSLSDLLGRLQEAIVSKALRTAAPLDEAWLEAVVEALWIGNGSGRSLDSIRGSGVHKRLVEQAINVRKAIAALSPPTDNDVVAWLAENVGLELSWQEVDGDLSECAWHVHRRHGGRNDREWTLIATGETPLEALTNARAALKVKP